MNPVGEAGNMFSSLFDRVPAKRPGNEEDIAGTVIYLVSRAGVRSFPFNDCRLLSHSAKSFKVNNIAQAYVDGISLCVDGGRTLVANGQEQS